MYIGFGVMEPIMILRWIKWSYWMNIKNWTIYAIAELHEENASEFK